MTKRIFKYRIDHRGGEVIESTLIPACAKFLYADFQHGGLFVWYEVNTEAPMVKRLIYYLMTGDGVHGKYLGSCQRVEESLLGGYFVAHIYEIEV